MKPEHGTCILRRAAKHESETIRAMLSPYLAELGVRDEYPYLPWYWSDPLRMAYLFETPRGDIFGFALVRREREEGPFEMAEFYILPPYRRDGMGQQAAHSLFLKHPGNWKVSVLADNFPALAFWRKVLLEHAGAPVHTQEDPSGKRVFTFSNI